MRGASGYIFAISMAVAATLVTVSDTLTDTTARLRAAHLQLADRNAQQLDPSRVCPGWWFGHSAKDIHATRKRMCGK